MKEPIAGMPCFPSGIRPPHRIHMGLCGILLLAVLQACGGGAQISLEGENPIVGSRYSPTLLIPERYGGDKAYVLAPTPPVVGVFVFCLDSITSPMRFDFFDMVEIFKQGTVDGMAFVENRDLAFVTTSSGMEGVFVFNPAGAFRYYASFTYTGLWLTLPQEMPDSEGNPVGTIQPVYTAGAALMNGKVYLPTSNYSRTGAYPVCDPGTVLIAEFDADADPPRFPSSQVSKFLVTTDFNPTEVTPLTDRILLVTNTGVLSIQGGKGIPLTNGSVDVVDTLYDCIVANYPLGKAAPSFSKIAVVQKGASFYRGYLGSASYNHVYELDFTGLEDKLLDADPGTCPTLDSDDYLTDKVLSPLRDPILATKNEPRKTANFIYQVAVNHDGTEAYATGFDSGTLAVLNIMDSSNKDPSRVFQVADPLPSQNETSPGPVAVRPGNPGEDFQGPDVFVVTGSPVGELRSVQTY